MKKKLHIAILCGGQSAEHEVSLLSARNVISAINPDKYEITLIGIDKQGQWHLGSAQELLLHPEITQITGPRITDRPLTLPALPDIDVAFPILHGPYGEDGTIQGLLKLARVPFVGSDVLGSAINMDKDVMKRLLRAAKLPVAKFLVFQRSTKHPIRFDFVVKRLGLPFFIKPANLGSSVGISKVQNQEEFDKAIQWAFEYDHKIIIEECIIGREIECSVLGNDKPIASLPGELIPDPKHGFYSYEAKYLDENGARFEIPAKLDEKTIKSIQKLAIQTFKTLCCNGMARVDFFLTPEGRVFINESNTIPGFTCISMYPKMWEASGVSYAELIEKLITLAIEKFESDQKLKTEHQIT